MDSEQQRRNRNQVLEEIQRRLDRMLSSNSTCEIVPRIIVKCGQVISCKFQIEDQFVLK